MKTLNELFDKPYKYTKKQSDYKSSWYTFMSDNGNEMYVKFQRLEQLNAPRVDRRRPDKSLYNILFGQTKKIAGAKDDVDSQTHEGDQFKIFSTVIKIIQEFYKNPFVGGVLVSTKDLETINDNIAARRKIYFALVKKLSKGQTVTRDIKEYPNGKIILKKGITLNRTKSADQMWAPPRPPTHVREA